MITLSKKDQIEKAIIYYYSVADQGVTVALVFLQKKNTRLQFPRYLEYKFSELRVMILRF